MNDDSTASAGERDNLGAPAVVALLPCPFCGSAAHTGSGFLPCEAITYAWCSNNDCELHLIDDCHFTLETWNRRATTAAPAKDVSTSGAQEQDERAAFEEWAQAIDFDTRSFAWLAWQARAASAQVAQLELAEAARFKAAMKEAWQMVDPFNPSGQPGSYARGYYNGTVETLRQVKCNFDRQSALAQQAEGARHG